MPLIKFDAVSKHYGNERFALRELSFSMEPGEMIFVTGHSGAGKSTLLKLIHLTERPSRGAVIFEDKNLNAVRGSAIAMHRRNVSAVFQDHRLLGEYSIFNNVAMPLMIAGLATSEIGKRVRTALAKVGLANRETALPQELSTGEQQRVGIARAIVSQPKLLIADVPTGNLDPQLAAEIMSLFALLPELGTSVLVASHDLALIRRMRKRTLVINQGQLADDISAEDLAS